MSKAVESSSISMGLARPIGGRTWPGGFFDFRRPLRAWTEDISSFDFVRSRVVCWRGVCVLGAAALPRRLDDHLCPGSVSARVCSASKLAVLLVAYESVSEGVCIRIVVYSE